MNQQTHIQPVTLGKDCWLDSGVRVTKGVAIGDDAVIGTSSVVTYDIQSY